MSLCWVNYTRHRKKNTVCSHLKVEFDESQIHRNRVEIRLFGGGGGMGRYPKLLVYGWISLVSIVLPEISTIIRRRILFCTLEVCWEWLHPKGRTSLFVWSMKISSNNLAHWPYQCLSCVLAHKALPHALFLVKNFSRLGKGGGLCVYVRGRRGPVSGNTFSGRHSILQTFHFCLSGGKRSVW